MKEIDLAVVDFTRYFETNKLGRLYFPNGKCVIPRGESCENAEVSNFFIRMDELYKMVCDWRVNQVLVPLEEIVAVIAFGSAVRYPGVIQVRHSRRKYLLFGETIIRTEEIPIQPQDADFLVITNSNLMREEILEPLSVVIYDCGTWIKKGGIHLVNRGISQLLLGIQANDTISVSALREGVPVFVDDRFQNVLIQAGIMSETPRKILWDTNLEGFLVGKIE